MNKVILFLFLSLSLRSYSQRNLFMHPDSLAKANNVKKMILRCKGKKGSGDNEWHYNKEGWITKRDVISSITGQPIIVTDYFFNSAGQPYASVMHGGENYSSALGSRTSSVIFFSVSSMDSVTCYYEYDRNARLSRMYRNDLHGGKLFDILYSYNPASVTIKNYDGRQRLFSEVLEDYEREKFITRSERKTYDSTGTVIATWIQDFKNTYNDAGQLTETNYQNDTCSCVTKYTYYKNGLIKSKKNEDCIWDNKYKYKYYKRRDQ